MNPQEIKQIKDELEFFRASIHTINKRLENHTMTIAKLCKDIERLQNELNTNIDRWDSIEEDLIESYVLNAKERQE